jgi:hypothetical protein
MITAITSADLRGLVDDLTPGADKPPTHMSLKAPSPPTDTLPRHPSYGNISSAVVSPHSQQFQIPSPALPLANTASNEVLTATVIPAVSTSLPPVHPSRSKSAPMSMMGGVPRPGNVHAPPSVPTNVIATTSSTTSVPATASQQSKAKTSQMPYPGAANPPPASMNSLPVSPSSFLHANTSPAAPPATGNFSTMQAAPFPQQAPQQIYTPAPMAAVQSSGDDAANSPPRRTSSAASGATTNASPGPSIFGSVRGSTGLSLYCINSIFVDV